jgi:hypothetical protein
MKKMKNFVPIITMFLLVATAYGQTPAPELKRNEPDAKTAKTYFDLMVNVVSTNINYGESNSILADSKKSNNGIQAGASFQAGITPAFSLVSELYFIRKGGILKANNPLSTSESNLRLNTIELPVLARFHLSNFFINAGPSLAYNISGKSEVANQFTKLLFTKSIEGYKRFDAGIQMGGGVEFPFKQRRIALDVRYNYGLTNISNSGEIYNRAIMISAHFSKPWKKNPLARNKIM